MKRVLDEIEDSASPKRSKHSESRVEELERTLRFKTIDQERLLETTHQQTKQLQYQDQKIRELNAHIFMGKKLICELRNQIDSLEQFNLNGSCELFNASFLVN